ncbi:MAG: aminopeptidase N [Alphaproteobacteria bacterium]|nr:aminopeptidase N [Alphaproteobacteria bacterium]
MADVCFTEARDYRPPAFAVDTIDLAFELDAERTVVRSRLHIRKLSVDAPIVLNGEGHELISIAMDGQPLPETVWRRMATQLEITEAPDAFDLEIVTACVPRANTSSRGLFLVGKTLATQCEAEGFRKITYFPDRPDVLSRYRVRLTADEALYPVLLSNGNLTGKGKLDGGRHWTAWEDPYPKPCYIFAVIAGDLDCLCDHFLTRSGRKVDLAIYSDTGVPERCRSALDSLKRALRWDETSFGLEYDLDTYNVVALTGYGGAMENKGLNLFDTSGILADPDIATDEEALTITRIIAHEAFHNWTGNRVTCRDWFQLGLKEGLTRYRDQRFTEDLTGGRFRIDAVRALMRNQFPEDDGPAAHPVQPSRYSTIENFYTNTVYDKGAELVRMLHTLLGPEPFQQGFLWYLAHKDGQAATIDDFLAAMETVSGRDLAQFRQWYHQAGRPRVLVDSHYDAHSETLRIELEQAGAAAERPLHIPLRIGLTGKSGKPVKFRVKGGPLSEDAVLELRDTKASITLEDVREAAILSLPRGFSAPVSLEQAMAPEDRLCLVLHDRDPYVRWDSAQNLFVTEIRRLAACAQRGEAMVVREHLLHGLAPLFAGEDDPWLLSELLLLPDEPRLSDGLAEVPLDSHMAARAHLQQALARRYEMLLRQRLLQPIRPDSAFPDMRAIGERRLALLALDYLMTLGQDRDSELCASWALHSHSMTLAQGALSILVNYDVVQRQPTLDAFYQRWTSYPTVINKWFMAQALSRMPGAVHHIVALEHHPALDKLNIARAMAYYGSFCRQNRVAFHDPSGAGYDFLAARLIEADRMGRASGRWLMAQITQWRRYDANRQARMRAALQRVLDTENISNGLRDLVAQTLNSGEPS